MRTATMTKCMGAKLQQQVPSIRERLYAFAEYNTSNDPEDFKKHHEPDNFDAEQSMLNIAVSGIECRADARILERIVRCTVSEYDCTVQPVEPGDDFVQVRFD